MNIGDRVRHKAGRPTRKGTITRVKLHLMYPMYVKWDNSYNEHCYYENELELIDENIIDVDKLFENIEI